MINRTALRQAMFILTCMGLSAGLWAMPAQALAVESFTATTGVDNNKGKKPKKSKAPQAKGDKSSAESKSERERRLLRECRGRPNAGACEGFAS